MINQSVQRLHHIFPTSAKALDNIIILTGKTFFDKFTGKTNTLGDTYQLKP